MLYTHNTYTNISGNIVNNNDELQWTNEHASLKNKTSHTLFSEGLMLVVCERWVGDGDRLLFWSKVLLSTIAELLPHLGSVAQPWVTEGPKPSVCRWFSIQHLVPNWLQHQLTQAVCVRVRFLFDVHLLPLFFRLFTLVHLLIDGSVESQYGTVVAIEKGAFGSPLTTVNQLT